MSETQSLIGKIDRFPLRKVWPHEAHHFTTWLADNLDVLSECISLDLSLIERGQQQVISVLICLLKIPMVVR